MTYAPFQMKQLRYVDHAATFPTSFTAGNNSTWTNANNLRITDVKLDLKYNAEKDATVQTGQHGHPAMITTDKGGSSIEFSMYLEGGSGTTDPPTAATFLGNALGALRNPGSATGTAAAGSNIDYINLVGHDKVVGEAVLVGQRGDGGGDGKLAAIKTIDNANKYSFFMAVPAAPVTTAGQLFYGHTAYMDATLENYMSFFLIGHYAGSGATDDPDQVNLLGCSCESVAISGISPGGAPKITMKWRVGDWRNEPNSTKATISHTATIYGNDPAGNLSIGALLIGDVSSYTRTTVQGGDVEINPNISLEMISDPNGSNYCGGWIQVPSDNGPTCNITRYWGDMPGLYDDFTGGTAKQVLIQWGNVATGTIGIFLQRAFLSSIPERIEFSKQMSLKLSFHGDRGRATNLSTADYKLQDSPLMIYFH